LRRRFTLLSPLIIDARPSGPRSQKWPSKYLAAPASSAGVERVFSAAGKMHDDLRKSAKDHSLKHTLFAAFNTK